MPDMSYNLSYRSWMTWHSSDESGEDQETEENVSESSTSHYTSRPSTPQTSLEASLFHQHCQVTINNPERAHCKPKQKSRDKSSDELEMEKVTIRKKCV